MPKGKPEIVTVPKINYIAVRGKGNPNEEEGEYKKSIELLYGIAYTIKMSKKGIIKLKVTLITWFRRLKVSGGKKMLTESITATRKTSSGFPSLDSLTSSPKPISNGQLKKRPAKRKWTFRKWNF